MKNVNIKNIFNDCEHLDSGDIKISMGMQIGIVERIQLLKKKCDKLKEDKDNLEFKMKDVAKKAIISMDEIMNLMDDIRSGDYQPDSFTNQPIEAARNKLKTLVNK